jgi:tetratricopeptide (TPR) repeat protein
MLVKRQMHLETDALKWVLVGCLAMLLALLLMAQTVAVPSETQTMPPPGPLPTDIEDVAAPMEGELVEKDQPRATSNLTVDPAMQLWQILADLDEERLNEAITGWNSLFLPPESEVWRQVGIASAYLQLVEFDPAVDALDAASSIDPDNPVVHYLSALLRLEQAYQAEELYEPGTKSAVRFAAYDKRPVVPNTKAMYQYAAMVHLHRAIELAENVNLVEPLVPTTWGLEGDTPTMPVVSPTVGDLLAYIGADNFAGKSHNILGDMYLQRDALDQAEEHMDAANATGLRIVRGYRDLGEKYSRDGRHEDAVRAYTKAMKQGEGISVPIQEIIRNLRSTMLR